MHGVVSVMTLLAEGGASDDVPLVKLTGIVLGVLLLYAAVRAMFGGGKNKKR
jgi:hypothetical protein